MTATTVAATDVSPADSIRRTFAEAWGEIGASWGVAPSTAAVQGYLLAHGGPLTEPELRRALDLSHRAASLALSQCESWGLIERAEVARRSGQRGPAAVAWVVVGDHWEWMRRVAKARREREAAPVLPVLDRCVTMAGDAAAERGDDEELAQLHDRLAVLMAFVKRFDRGVEIFVSGKPRDIERFFVALDTLGDETVTGLWQLVGELSADEMTTALTALAALPPSAVRRLIRLADQPALRRLLRI